MQKIVILITMLTAIMSCNSKPNIPKNSVIVSKYVVFDENISPKLNVCPDKPKEFIINPSACVFKLDTFIFQSEYVIILDDNGNMVQQENHGATGYIDYNKNGIEKDTTNWTKISGLDFWIRFSKDRSTILDGTDTLTIDRVFPKEKLIFVEKSRERKGRRFIYQYK